MSRNCFSGPGYCPGMSRLLPSQHITLATALLLFAALPDGTPLFLPFTLPGETVRGWASSRFKLTADCARGTSRR